MPIRSLLAEVRCALRAGKSDCGFSDADLEVMISESIEEIRDGRCRDRVVECAIAKAHALWTDMMLSSGQRSPRRRRQR